MPDAIIETPLRDASSLSDHFPQHRMVQRCAVDGDRPFYRANIG